MHKPTDTRIFLKECRSLAERGYEVVLVAPAQESWTRDGVRLHAVRPARSRRDRMVGTVARVLRAAVAERGDVYHFHDPELMPVGLALKAMGRRVVYDVHEDMPREILAKEWIAPPLRRSLALATAAAERVTASAVDALVTVTPSINARFPSRKAHLVQNFPILGELAPPTDGDQVDREPAVLYMGDITEVRGIREMVQAMALVPAELGARMLLAGTFSPPDLQPRIEQVEGYDRVEFAGWQDRRGVRDLLARARAGLVLFHPTPNHVSAQPNKLFEYMSAGIPVIASDFPRWREIIGGERCGLLVDPLDPEAIAAAIATVLRDPAGAAAMGERGRVAVLERFNWSTQADVLGAAYTRVLGRAPAR